MKSLLFLTFYSDKDETNVVSETSLRINFADTTMFPWLSESQEIMEVSSRYLVRVYSQSFLLADIHREGNGGKSCWSNVSLVSTTEKDSNQYLSANSVKTVASSLKLKKVIWPEKLERVMVSNRAVERSTYGWLPNQICLTNNFASGNLSQEDPTSSQITSDETNSHATTRKVPF